MPGILFGEGVDEDKPRVQTDICVFRVGQARPEKKVTEENWFVLGKSASSIREKMIGWIYFVNFGMSFWFRKDLSIVGLMAGGLVCFDLCLVWL